MSFLRPTYPRSLLAAVKKGPEGPGKPPLLRELSNTIATLLANDPDVHRLIKDKAKLEPPYKFADISNVLDDPDVQKLIMDKTWPTYSSLIAKSFPQP